MTDLRLVTATALSGLLASVFVAFAMLVMPVLARWTARRRHTTDRATRANRLAA